MLKKVVLLSAAFGILAAPALAQSPNTSTVVVLVTDQSGAVVKDAKVSVTNNQTGAVREAMSGGDGSATFPALSLTGTYTASVSKQGFATEEHRDISLRAGETATLRVKLVLGTEKSEVTVYGTSAGVRADPPARAAEHRAVRRIDLLKRNFGKIDDVFMFRHGSSSS